MKDLHKNIQIEANIFALFRFSKDFLVETMKAYNRTENLENI